MLELKKVESVLVRISIVLFSCFFALFAAPAPLVFDTLAEPLQKSTASIEKLSQKPVMEPNKNLLRNFLNGVDATLSVGRELSSTKEIDKEILGAYLKELRELARTKESIDVLYRKSLNAAMTQSDKKSFEDLVTVALDPLHHPRIRSEVIEFYRKNYPHHSIKSIEALCDEQALEQKSIQIAIEQEQAYEEHLRILKRSEVSGVKKTAQIGSRNSVILSAESNGVGGYEFEAENLNPYTVTMSIDFESLNNLQTLSKLPLFIEIPGRSKKRVLELSRISHALGADYRSSYGWVRGSAFAVHQNDYIYKLPFLKGSNVHVSQGYHGETSHKGLSAYAVDFPVPVGTPIYAAREGIVVGAEGGSNQGGATPEYRQYANYVIVEHRDGTMGNYYHLKQGGAIAVIGQKVFKGDLIGYSGNTGYSSGPHLHFSVSKVDPISMRRPMNLPIKMETAQGIVNLPRKGDRYTVQ
ncbi:MAG: M23 family metallopeptidase [Sulfuricurvum sp.]|uniref:M23 family metallopeptidase n=1 Tax=Sulfuricurvum sp. TaxID=2025608 RepID=UPI002734D987|nr:M23 family metallopeptidase [Sulfuricurvum sp.]MDP2849465.1 M23 family metallopeptidase [Sulfuricurvum sp.]MDP3291177.1 M23 family metallopeptidase [Sulfuricurvum sp.]